MIPGVCRHLGDKHVDPDHPRAAYARGEAIPDGFERYGVAVDRGVSAQGEFDRSAAGMADARDRERDFLRPARRDHVAAAAEGLPALADGVSLVCTFS